MPSLPNAVVAAGFLIGLGFGVVGLLSGFCLTSGLRNWWIQGDGRMIRTFALALATAIFATQLLAGDGVVDLTKSIYLLPSFSAPVMLFGGLLFGYGMVMANACPRARWCCWGAEICARSPWSPRLRSPRR